MPFDGLRKALTVRSYERLNVNDAKTMPIYQYQKGLCFVKQSTFTIPFL